jgi:hypothetical protein
MKNILIPILLLNIFAISCSNIDIVELRDNVHLKKSGKEKFELIFDKGTDEEWTYENVDSLAISEYYGFLFYGMIKNGKEKKWFYVTGAPLEFKKGFGNWYDSEFRKYRLKELYNGIQLYESLKSTEQIWNEIN